MELKSAINSKSYILQRVGYPFMIMPPDHLGSFAVDDGGQRFRGGLLDLAEAAEVSQKALAGLRADAGDG